MSRTARAAILAVCLLAGLLATAAPALAATITVDVGAADRIDDPGRWGRDPSTVALPSWPSVP